MKAIQHLMRLQRLHLLISRKSTGKPEDLAQRLNVSRATLFRHLEELRAFGAPLEYNKNRETYQYQEPFELNF